jgi:5-methyltetrahydropteroyltriglutamate--homocysteine methyltransferase
MQRSIDRIRTAHVGSLARPPALLDLMKAAAGGQPGDPAELAETERLAVADVVARQRSAGRGRPPGHRPALALTS